MICVEIFKKSVERLLFDIWELKYHVIWVGYSPSQSLPFFTLAAVCSNPFLHGSASSHQDTSVTMQDFASFKQESDISPSLVIDYFPHVVGKLWLAVILFELYKNDCVIKATSHIDHLLIVEGWYLFGKFLIFCAAMTKLAMISSTKSINEATITQSNRMIAPAGYLCDIHSLCYIACSLWRGLWRIGKRDSWKFINSRLYSSWLILIRSKKAVKIA